jgi:hypothetical protein
MPALEYTIEVVSDMDFKLPTAEQMAEIVEAALHAWNDPERLAGYLDVEVTRVSDDL